MCWFEDEQGLLRGKQSFRGGSVETSLQDAAKRLSGVVLPYGRLRFSFRGFRVVKLWLKKDQQ